MHHSVEREGDGGINSLHSEGGGSTMHHLVERGVGEGVINSLYSGGGGE